MGHTAAQWVESNYGQQLTDFQAKAVNLLCAAMRCGPYDISGTTWEKAQWQWGVGVRFVLWRPQLSTFDTDGLTTLVIGAHEQCIRVEISPVSFHHLAIEMHPRATREGDISRRHPTIEQALERYRSVHAPAEEALT